MKKIIDRKTFDTSTATEIGSWWNKLSRSDFNRLSETLYKTKKGRYFLHGEGGANTHYSKLYGNMSSGSEDIIPCNEGGAMDWLEKHDLVDEFEKEFSDELDEA